jgi:Secretion system C-terminal sorting domain
LYGTYCIKVINNPSCYDTTITRCFTVNRPIPSVGAVSIIERACMGFTAKIVGQAFLNNPVYCLYDSANVLIGCNTFGTFSSLPFGSYCITIKNDPSCYDTIIRKCFTVLPTPAEISLTAKKSCVTLGTTDIKVNINSGFAVYKLTLLSPTGAVLQIVFTYSNTYTFTALPALAASLQYRVAINDQCGTTDTVGITPVVSRVKPLVYVSQKCPSGIWPNGSADVVVNVSDNNIGGNIVPKIIKKDGVTVNINASLVAGYKYTFLNLGPATYVFDTYVEDCNKHVYDTVVVRIYLFPILTGTNAYQCDNNGFNVSVHVAGGIGPYTYEIIGSEPALPSIVSAPQASPVFAINNGTVYSLVRLRVVDACGNASLYDVSVLPLANFLVFADTLPCFNQSFTLRVDSIANAQFTWYKRIEPNDSIIVGTGASLYFANLAFSDTGRYFCKIVVGSGCLIRYANYVVTGFCGVLPANDITLKGTKQTDGNKLEWHTGLGDIKEWDLQKSANGSSGFKSIKILNHTPSTNAAVIDKNPVGANNYYRLKITAVDNSIKYSNVVVIKNSKFQISVYPNPVQNKLSIAITSISPKNYLVEISTISGQKILSKTYSALQNQVIEYVRNEAMGSGLYLLTVTDLQTKEKQTYKLVYK